MAFAGADGRVVRAGSVHDLPASQNIFTEGELNRDSVVAIFATTAADGKTYQVD